MRNSVVLIIALAGVFLAACAESYSIKDLELKYANHVSKFVSIDGNRIHYRDEGVKNDHKGVIVLIHGTASSLHTWDLWVPELSKDYRVVRMDLPGFGLTGPDHENRYEVEDDVRFLTAFLEKLNLDKVHLVGSSLGGRIAWQFALENKSRVKSLTLLNSLGYEQGSWPPAIQMGQWPIVDRLMEIISPRFMYADGLRDVYFDKSLITEELVDRYFELSRVSGNLKAFTRRVKARLDQDAELIKGIEVTTLIMWGREDKYFPVSNAERFKADIKNSRVKIYNEVGHLPMEELPLVSVADYMTFLQENVR